MNALELNHVNIRLDDFTIQNLTLALPQGTVMGLVGENGAGKSTTIRMLLGSLKPDSGTIQVLGQSQDKDFDRVKEDLGVVLDEPCFPECLNAKNVNNVMARTYRNWNRDQFYDYLRRFELPEDKAFKDYSRGMKMKLAIAVALSHDAKLLLLDEATSGLDPVVRDEILDIFFEFTRDEAHSILLSSHIVSDLEKVCDYIAFLHKGRMLVCQEKELLLERFGLVHCSREQLPDLGPAVRGKKETPYGVDALVERDEVPRHMQVSPVGVEDLFIYLTKEAD